ncbi:zona pellucida sperm-binding protein 4-like isoform X2 [Cheilinus undulatus]|uniref:zona pellucida sperm-binding protein 4-like isoform X2 n=1 Tax=Cheilinus undulatus TaxID=241271 RepID=UPI001BD3FAED|nr:zona pellucida sperm-binding protein 4-like isoform X2 [Cheilinus undulatus]
MVACSTHFISLRITSLLLLPVIYEAHAVSKQIQATVPDPVNSDVTTCHDGFMSVYISKKQFADLPFTIYVQDEHGGYHQAVAVAKQCRYILGETETFVILTVPPHGCYVRRQVSLQKYLPNLTVVILAYTDHGGLEVVKTIPVSCERKTKGHLFCNTDGFKVTIPKNATVPPLNLDTVWIPSSQSEKCKPQNRSTEAVTFTFPFTDCGTQSRTEDGIITYWVNFEVKRHPQEGSVFCNTPFNLTVGCSFLLAQTSHLGFNIEGEKPEELLALRSEGILRAEMRFAKDSSYRSFYSSRYPPATELSLPVFVEVFVLKHENKDLVLLLHDCWATPTKNALDPQRWNLLDKGCPFSGDTHRTVVLPVVSSKELNYPSLHKRFVVKMFSFVKPQTFRSSDAPLEIYFHCDIEICKGPDCSQSCSNERRKSRWTSPLSGRRILHGVVSGGPLLYPL